MSEKNDYFEGVVHCEVWGEDWTKNFKPDDFIPRTLLLDPNGYLDKRWLSKEEARLIVSRQPIMADSIDFPRLCEKIGAVPSSNYPCISFVAGFPAHNSGTKFGERDVAVASPVIVNVDRFVGNNDLIPYFVYEQNLIMVNAAKIYVHDRTDMSPYETERIIQDAKTTSMQYALYKGDLAKYLKFHDEIFSPHSENESTLKVINRKNIALTEIAEKYTSIGFRMTNALLGVARLPKKDIANHWRGQMWRKGFSFDYLNEPIKSK